MELHLRGEGLGVEIWGEGWTIDRAEGSVMCVLVEGPLLQEVACALQWELGGRPRNFPGVRELALVVGGLVSGDSNGLAWMRECGKWSVGRSVDCAFLFFGFMRALAGDEFTVDYMLRGDAGAGWVYKSYLKLLCRGRLESIWLNGGLVKELCAGLYSTKYYLSKSWLRFMDLLVISLRLKDGRIYSAYRELVGADWNNVFAGAEYGRDGLPYLIHRAVGDLAEIRLLDLLADHIGTEKLVYAALWCGRTDLLERIVVRCGLPALAGDFAREVFRLRKMYTYVNPGPRAYIDRPMQPITQGFLDSVYGYLRRYKKEDVLAAVEKNRFLKDIRGSLLSKEYISGLY